MKHMKAVWDHDGYTLVKLAEIIPTIIWCPMMYLSCHIKNSIDPNRFSRSPSILQFRKRDNRIHAYCFCSFMDHSKTIENQGFPRENYLALSENWVAQFASFFHVFVHSIFTLKWPTWRILTGGYPHFQPRVGGARRGFRRRRRFGISPPGLLARFEVRWSPWFGMARPIKKWQCVKTLYPWWTSK